MMVKYCTFLKDVFFFAFTSHVLHLELRRELGRVFEDQAVLVVFHQLVQTSNTVRDVEKK